MLLCPDKKQLKGESVYLGSQFEGIKFIHGWEDVAARMRGGIWSFSQEAGMENNILVLRP